MANIKSVKEIILDEQKLVTYVSLSKELCIHVNESKNLLKLVVDEIKEKHADVELNVTFILSGLLNDNSARTLVCSEKELDDEKKKLKTLFFQHIYSVSPGTNRTGVDTAAFVSLNSFEDFSLCSGLIRSNMCIKRSTDEIGTLKSRNQAAVESHKPVAIPKKEKGKDSTHSTTDNKTIVRVQQTKSEPIVKTEVISPKKEPNSTSSNGKVNGTNVKKPAKGIAGFFSKTNSAPTIKSKPVQENGQKKAKSTKPNERIVEVKEEEMDIDIEDDAPNEKIIPKEAPSSKVKEEPKNTSKSKKNSTNKIKKTTKVEKKRKRVLCVSDSETEEDPFADEKPELPESDDEIPPTPSTNTVKITSGILNPKKRRKLVDKTYTDEDGYILTRKEEVLESCSDDDDVKQPEVKTEKENVEKPNKIKSEVSPPSKKAKVTKKKISPPQKGKQATMMNFFKKI